VDFAHLAMLIVALTLAGCQSRAAAGTSSRSQGFVPATSPR